MEALEKVIRDLHLWQYYVLDPVREKDAVKSAIASGTVEAWKVSDFKGKSAAELALIFLSTKKIQGLGQFAKRFGMHVDGSVAAGFAKAAFEDSETNDSETLATLWKSVVDILNVDFYKEWEEDTKAAIGFIRNRAKYLRLDPNGPKRGSISKE